MKLRTNQMLITYLNQVVVPLCLSQSSTWILCLIDMDRIDNRMALMQAINTNNINSKPTIRFRPKSLIILIWIIFMRLQDL
jgi:hypothetical protein